MLEIITTYVSENFDKLFFSIITLIVFCSAVLDYKDKNYPPGPMGLPFFGYLPILNSEAPYLTLNELVQQYGRVFSVQFGSVYTVIVADVNLILEVLNSETFHGRPPLFSTNGTIKTHGLTATECENWKDHKRFVSSILRDIGGVNSQGEKTILELRFEKSAMELVQELKRKTGSEFDIIPSLRHSVGSVLVSIVLGIRFDKINSDWNILQETYETGRQVSSLTGTLNYVPWFRRFISNEVLTSFEFGLHESHQIYEEIMNKQEKMVDVNNISSVLDAYIIELKRREGNDVGIFTKEQVYHVLSDLIGVGWESSMTTLKWLFLYMAIYPDVQAKISSEISELKRRDGEITLEDLKVLPYTEATIMETWRHASILPLGIPHETQKNTKLGEFLIPKGSLIVPLFWTINHDSRLWDKPNAFSPERFLNEDGTLRRNKNLIQTGRTMCIGDDLSRSIVRLFFTNIINNFYIHLPKGLIYKPDQIPEYGVTLVPKSCNLILENRH